MPEPFRGRAPDRRVLLALMVLAAITRLVWVLWLHPPADYVFSDMRKYVERAQHLAEHGIVPGDRTMAWQVWGTHYILAIPLAIFGRYGMTVAAALNGVLSALAVPLTYLLACRVSARRYLPEVAGVAALLWLPNMSLAGYFLSETPFLFFQLWSTYWLVVAFQDGRRALGAGIASAIAFAVRPQSALFYLFVFATWLVNARRLPHVRPRHLAMVAGPLLLVLGFSFWRFHLHTGYWGGIAENANMNFTAGRCHNIVTQAFRSQAELDHSNRRRSTADGRRVSLPGFRTLWERYPGKHPFGLRPALGGETIKFVGYIGDPDIHREFRRRCYERTGFLEQLRYSMLNMSLLWFWSHQWPEMEKNHRIFYPSLAAYRRIYQVAIWLPSLVGIAVVLARIRRNPGGALLGWQLVTSMTIAAIFFGDVRLRTPYDPYAIILALETWALVLALTKTKLARWRARGKTPGLNEASSARVVEPG